MLLAEVGPFNEASSDSNSRMRIFLLLIDYSISRSYYSWVSSTPFRYFASYDSILLASY